MVIMGMIHYQILHVVTHNRKKKPNINLLLLDTAALILMTASTPVLRARYAIGLLHLVTHRRIFSNIYTQKNSVMVLSTQKLLPLLARQQLLVLQAQPVLASLDTRAKRTEAASAVYHVALQTMIVKTLVSLVFVESTLKLD